MIDPDALLSRRCPPSEMATLGPGLYAFYLRELDRLPDIRIATYANAPDLRKSAYEQLIRLRALPAVAEALRES